MHLMPEEVVMMADATGMDITAESTVVRCDVPKSSPRSRTRPFRNRPGRRSDGSVDLLTVTGAGFASTRAFLLSALLGVFVVGSLQGRVLKTPYKPALTGDLCFGIGQHNFGNHGRHLDCAQHRM